MRALSIDKSSNLPGSKMKRGYLSIFRGLADVHAARAARLRSRLIRSFGESTAACARPRIFRAGDDGIAPIEIRRRNPIGPLEVHLIGAVHN